MGTSLTGTTPQDTYDSLIKVTDNGPLSGSLKTLTDGLGNDSALALSSGAASVTGTLNVSGDVSIADKIVHTGDTNTSLRFPANDTFTVETAGSERMRISSAGNIGIGTTSPVVRTHIVGPTLSISSETTYPLWLSDTADTTKALTLGYDLANDVGVIQAVDQATSWKNISIASNGGKVGIGTTTLPYKFNVYDTSDAVVGHFGGGSSNYTLVSFLSNESNVYSTSLGSYNSGLLFRTSAADRMYITSSGDVGIGTNSPSQKLHVEGSIALAYGSSLNAANATYTKLIETGYNGSSDFVSLYTAGNNAGNATAKITMLATGNVGIGLTSPSAKLEVQDGASGAAVKVSNSGGGYAQLAISSNATSVAELSFTNSLSLSGGNVGIGTSSPNRLLTIKNSSDGANGLSFQSYASTSELGYIRYEQTDDILDIVNTSGFPSGGIKFSTSNTERMRITAAGNVGIGVTSPSTKLDVSGAINIKSTNTITWGGAYGSGTPAISGNKLSSYLSFFPAGSTSGETMRITNSGQVGISITPQDWWGSRKAIEIFQGGAYAGVNAGWMEVWGNSYLDNSATTRYLQTGGATLYQSGNVLGGGAHTFLTAPSGNAGDPCPLVEKVRIDNDGLKFNGDTAAANALDDYEEGTWTPTDASGAGLTFVAASGNYTKIGREVSYRAVIVYPSTADVNLVEIGGLPFTVPNNNQSRGGYVTYSTTSALSYAITVLNTTKVGLTNNTGTSLTNVQLTGATIFIGGSYNV